MTSPLSASPVQTNPSSASSTRSSTNITVGAATGVAAGLFALGVLVLYIHWRKRPSRPSSSRTALWNGSILRCIEPSHRATKFQHTAGPMPIPLSPQSRTTITSISSPPLRERQGREQEGMILALPRVDPSSSSSSQPPTDAHESLYAPPGAWCSS